MCGLLARLREASELAGQRGFDGDVQYYRILFRTINFYVRAKAWYAIEGTAYPSHFPKTPGKPDRGAAYISEDSPLVNEFVARGVLNLCYRLGERDWERPGDVAVACSDFQRNRAMPLCSNGVALPD